MKISTMVIGLVLVSLGAILFGGLIGQYTSHYGLTNYDNSTIEKMNKLNELDEFSKEMRDNTSIKADSSLFDILGSYFSSGYKSARIAAGSVDTLESMASAATEEVGQQVPYVEHIRNALIVMLVVAVFVGIIIAALIKWRV